MGKVKQNMEKLQKSETIMRVTQTCYRANADDSFFFLNIVSVSPWKSLFAIV